MRSNLVWGLSVVAGLLIGASVGQAQLADQIADQIKHGVPVVGIDVGAALPISDFQKTADPGGAVAPFVGYQIGESFTVTPLIQGQFAGFPSCCGGTASITSVGGGARFSLNDENTEVYFGAAGNYYWATSGPERNHDGPGFNIQGGVNYDFWRGIGLGLFARYDNADLCPAKGSGSCTTEYVTVGLEGRYRFLPAPPPPPPAPVAAAPPPTPAPIKKKIVLRGVNFDFDKSNIRPDAVPILDEAAKTLKEYGDVTVSVDGYTDSIGTEEYNQRLSVRRANAVKEYLEKQGVAASRMTARGFGESNPVASNETAEGRAQNRRVELIVKE
jgi:outer membrane protein OmpA-like peptidoglycan-associated protein